MDNEVKRFLTVVGTVVVGLVAVLTLWLSWYTVPEGYRGVITRNGAVVGVAEPGLGFKVPFVDSVTDMSVQTQRDDYENVAAYSKDIQQAVSYVTVNYRLDPSAVLEMYAEVGTDYASRLLHARVFKHVKEVFGKFAAADIVNRRDAVSNDIEQALIEDMAQFGVIVEDVQLANIDFSDAYELAVEAAAKAEADVKRAKQELEKIRVDAQQKVAQAEADAEAVRLAADAEAYQIKAKGDAEAAAIRARAQALRENPQLVELMAVERWSGTLPTTMVPGAAVPFVNVK